MVEIHPLCHQIINLPEFQRLRDLKQLGCLYYIYPGATHDRFQHCIGVYHLAEIFVEHLQKTHKELNITEKEKLAVCIGGLVHDIGHITLCHVYPRFVEYCGKQSPIPHETMGVIIFKYLINKRKLKKDFEDYNLGEDDIHLICEIIAGSKEKCPADWEWKGAPGREFLLQIVANAKNGIDVDRFDYMLRDCFHLGLNCSYNYDNIILRSRCIKNSSNEWEICFNEKVFLDVCDMFQCRLNLFRRAYNHRSNRAIDQMLMEAFRSAEDNGFGIMTSEGLVKLSDATALTEAYLKATDYLILELKNSVEKRYEAARLLIQRVELHDYYRFLGEDLIAKDDLMNKSHTPCKQEYKNRVEKEFIAIAEKEGIPFDPSLLLIDICKMDMGTEGANPLSTISFFNESDPDHIIDLSSSAASLFGAFQDWKVFFYTRGNKESDSTMKKLFQLWRESRRKV